MKKIQRLFNIHPWKVSTHQLDRTNRRLQESLTSIGNGYMGMRGNFEEGYTGDHHAGTYLAGVWYPDKTRVGWWKNGYPDYFGKVINALNFIALDITIDGEKLDLGLKDPKDFSLELDMQNGLLTRQFIIETSSATLEFTFKRFLSIVTKELAVISLDVRALKGQANVEVVSKLDGDVRNEDSNYDEMFWEHQAAEIVGESAILTTKTIPNNFGIEQFTVTAAMNNETNAVLKETICQDYLVAKRYEATVSENCPLHVLKKVIVITSRDVDALEQKEVAHALLSSQTKKFKTMLDEQTTAWAKRWQIADVVIEGDEEAQQGIRFNLFQLFSTYYGEDARLNIGPKGFTGEKYGGATYWDTEAYAVPLYLSLAGENVTKNLLTYRHAQLPQAQHNAAQQGLKGALYPMVTFTGVECHNEWEITFEEIHRNGAIAYAIYNYTNYTGDETYMQQEGLEVLTEISRFWADRVHYSKRNDRYMMHGVTGPNEYENNVNNNWYTNYIAAWVLAYTSKMYQYHQAKTTVVISDDELAKWSEIVEKMYYPEDKEQGIFVQHDTFLDKELIPVSELDPKHLPLNQNWSWDRVLRSCFIKQADVLQGIYFFNDAFSLEEKRRNFDFYEPMTVHESSLSPCIHAVLAAELGMEEKAVEMYQRTARLDLDNYNNDTEDGLHITSMTGSWLAIVQGFAQMKTANTRLSFAPFLPEIWQTYAFHINYRGSLLEVKVTNEKVLFTLVSGASLEITVYNENYLLQETLAVDLKEVGHV